MLEKQIERLINKMFNLINVYDKYVIKEEIEINEVLLDGKKINKGEIWGKDFGYGTFSFKVPHLKNEEYYLFCLTGAVEHLVSINNKKMGMLDYVPHAMDPSSRIHKYLYLENVKENDLIEVEAYYSHPIPGTFPYHSKSTFSLDDLYENRPYQYISLVTFDENLKLLIDKMLYLKQLYLSTDCYAKKNYLINIYEDLFKVLSLKDERPESEGVEKALLIIDKSLEKYDDVKPYVGLIGHSHLDTAWLWKIEETHHKLLRTVANAVTLLHKYPDYKFFISSVLYLEWLKEDDYSLYLEVINLMKENRIEVNGATWVEFDSNLIGNEALCRQFLKGKLYLKKYANKNADTFFLPDTFGYSASLPQVLKQSGVKYFLTTKLSWNDTNTFPYDTFKWVGIDGSSVNVHFNTIHSYVDIETVEKRLKNVIDKVHTTDVLIAYGFGDGGGGPSKDMVERAIMTTQKYNKAVIEHTTISSFMERISEKQLPIYFGELYLELHRGTFTSIHEIKKQHAKLSVALHNAELYSVISNDKNIKKITDEAYDVLMLNEFHDILPGTCIKEVNDEAIKQMKETIERVENIYTDTSLFNPLFIERMSYVDDNKGISYIDFDGHLKHLSLYKFSSLDYGKEIEEEKNQLFFDGINFKTPIYSGKIEKGIIKSLVYDGHELVGEGFNILKGCVNIPYIYDNWDIDRDYKLKEQEFDFVSLELVNIEKSALILRTLNQFKNSYLITDIYFYQNSPLIEFKNKLVINDDHLLIRSYFDTNIFSDHYTSDIQFGLLKRNTYPSSFEDEAKFEVCSHKFVDLSDQSYGVTIFKKDLYGTSCDESTLGLTVHKGGTHPDEISEKGVHYFEYALCGHHDGLNMKIIDEAYKYNYPIISLKKQDLSKIVSIVDNDSVIIETIKWAEDDGIIVRMYESLGQTSKIELKFNREYDVRIVNLLEEEQEYVGKTEELTLEFRPFMIKTILLK